ncbi:unnamed protein product [Parascedosporium putredinis]|uniref:Alcohol acetyltransferase n=1 Tax=Parascedosporium putredinis TaxID=1442378 RepID=A0A9P1GWZ1_9PEZI|nr:unnamed protein product [Parascedosporium putredinis]CAI7989346.1 unnamed protein product [Parascedosporium putredinis]
MVRPEEHSGLSHTNDPAFTHLPTIDLGNHFEWQPVSPGEPEEAVLVKVVEAKHSTPWPDIVNRSPWSITIIGNPEAAPHVDVVFAYHHAIGDGLSGKIIQNALLSALLKTPIPSGDIPDALPTLRYPEPPSLPPSQEDAVNITLSWRYILKAIWSEIRPSFLAPAVPKYWSGAPIDLARPYKTRARIVTIDGETASNLVALCRTHGTTLTGLAHALMFTSFIRQLPDEKVYLSQTPMTLRPYASAPGWDLNKTMSVLVTSFTHSFTPEEVAALRSRLSEGTSGDDAGSSLEDKIWEVAGRVKRELNKRAETLPADDIVGLLRWVSDWHERAKKLDGKARSSSWEVSNVGVISGGDDSGVAARISRHVFTQSAVVTGAGVGASVAGCKESGTVTIGLTWQDGVIDDALVEGVASDLEKWSVSLGASGKLR